MPHWQLLNGRAINDMESNGGSCLTGLLLLLLWYFTDCDLQYFVFVFTTVLLFLCLSRMARKKKRRTMMRLVLDVAVHCGNAWGRDVQ